MIRRKRKLTAGRKGGKEGRDVCVGGMKCYVELIGKEGCPRL